MDPDDMIVENEAGNEMENGLCRGTIGIPVSCGCSDLGGHCDPNPFWEGITTLLR